MTALPTILAIDAASRFGWAAGRPGERPLSGSDRFAKPKASKPAIAAGAMRWLVEWVKANGKPDMLVIEAPLVEAMVSMKTNRDTKEILVGLPFALGGMACTLGIYDIWHARVSDIRAHFIGRNIKGEAGKEKVWRKCRDLDWIRLGDEDVSHDRSDALAIWSYACTVAAPQTAHPVDDLFVASEKRKRERAL